MDNTVSNHVTEDLKDCKTAAECADSSAGKHKDEKSQGLTDEGALLHEIPLTPTNENGRTVSLSVVDREVTFDEDQSEERISEPSFRSGHLDSRRDLPARLRQATDSESYTITSFFKREYKAFQEERKKILYKIPEESTPVDVFKLAKEWNGKDKASKKYWATLVNRRPGETCPVILPTVLIGLAFTFFPNCLILLDWKTAYEYWNGTWYYIGNLNLTQMDNGSWYTQDEPPVKLNYTECQKSSGGFWGIDYPLEGYECIETDKIWGVLTFFFTFTSGPIWSFNIFYHLWCSLIESNKDFYDRKRMWIFCFIPLAIVCMVTFPLQLILISLVSVINDQEEWTKLTIKIGIAEGLYNAHYQFMLQLYIFCEKQDRLTLLQQTILCGSLLFLVYSRIETLLISRGGARMTIGQRLWWILKYGPSFLFNCTFKVGSIALLSYTLRFNIIWVYGSLILLWLVLHMVLCGTKTGRRYYYIILGAGMHAVTVFHGHSDLRLVDAFSLGKKMALWSTRLNSKHIRNLKQRFDYLNFAIP